MFGVLRITCVKYGRDLCVWVTQDGDFNGWISAEPCLTWEGYLVHPVGAGVEGREDPKQLGMAESRYMMAHAFFLRLGISLSFEALQPSLSLVC